MGNTDPDISSHTNGIEACPGGRALERGGSYRGLSTAMTMHIKTTIEYQGVTNLAAVTGTATGTGGSGILATIRSQVVAALGPSGAIGTAVQQAMNITTQGGVVTITGQDKGATTGTTSSAFTMTVTGALTTMAIAA